jgi:hypothetical protein
MAAFAADDDVQVVADVGQAGEVEPKMILSRPA